MTLRKFDRLLIVNACLCFLSACCFAIIPLYYRGFHAESERHLSASTAVRTEVARSILDIADTAYFVLLPCFATSFALMGVIHLRMLRKRRQLKITEMTESDRHP